MICKLVEEENGRLEVAVTCKLVEEENGKLEVAVTYKRVVEESDKLEVVESGRLEVAVTYKQVEEESNKLEEVAICTHILPSVAGENDKPEEEEEIYRHSKEAVEKSSYNQ